jgi:hypothetical protein
MYLAAIIICTTLFLSYMASSFRYDFRDQGDELESWRWIGEWRFGVKWVEGRRYERVGV